MNKLTYQSFFYRDAYVPFHSLDDAGFDKDDISLYGLEFLTIEEAQSLEHNLLFDLLIRKHPNCTFYDALPRISEQISHIYIPYSCDEHPDNEFNGYRLDMMVETIVNENMQKEKFLISCDPNHFVAARCSKFQYEIIYGLSWHGGANSSFLLFDLSRRFWIVFCSELPFVSISYRSSGADKMTPKLPFRVDDMQDYFRSSWKNATRHYADMSKKEIVRNYFRRSLSENFLEK